MINRFVFITFVFNTFVFNNAILVFSLQAQPAPPAPIAVYVLAPDDAVTIRVSNVEEIGAAPFVIDSRGNINLPRVGRIHAAGLTAEQLEEVIAGRFKEYLQAPDVTVTTTGFRSQPVSVLGAVNVPGVHQVLGRKTLFEVLSQVGGLRADAGNSIKITRRKEWGPIPLPSAVPDASGEFSVAEVNAKSVMEATNPQENIVVKPYDVISVPKADMVYVIGAVKKPGGYMLSERTNVSVLQAMAMSDGLDRFAAPKNAKILRATPGNGSRTEIPVDLQKIMSTKGNDVPLMADDILFIPTSAAKSATLRSIEAAIQIGTGLALYSGR